MGIGRAHRNPHSAADLRKHLRPDTRHEPRAGGVEVDEPLAAGGLDDDDLAFDLAFPSRTCSGRTPTSPSADRPNRAAASGGRKFIAGLPTNEATNRSAGRA
jgi:hypothetical protein